MAQPTKTRITATDYAREYAITTQPMELIDGEVVVAPAPFDRHQFVVTTLSAELYWAAERGSLGDVRVAPSDVYFDAYNVLQPDVFFVAKNNPRCHLGADNYWHGAPDICVEVLSESTRQRDLKTKFAIYEKNGVREYWIIDTDAQTLQIYHGEAGRFGEPTQYTEQDLVRSRVLPQIDFRLAVLLPKE